MKSLLAMIAVFSVALGGLWYLDREDKLPDAYRPSAAKADDKPPPPRWYTLSRPFALTLRDDRSVRMTVALQLPTKLPKFVREGETAGELRQEAVIRQLITDTVMAQRARTMRSSAGRRRVERLLRRRIRAHTDVRARRVVFPDIIVG